MLKQIRCCLPLLLCIVGTSAYVDTIYSQPRTFSLQAAPNTNLTFSNSGRYRTVRTPLSKSFPQARQPRYSIGRIHIGQVRQSGSEREARRARQPRQCSILFRCGYRKRGTS